MFHHLSRTTALTALSAAAALALAGCADTKLPPIGLSANAPAPAEAAARENTRNAEGPARAARPSGPAAAVAEARQLRQAGHKAQALNRLDSVAASSPGDVTLSRERGLLALELGQLDKAETLLRQAVDPARPDWRIHSALGAALSAKGRQSDAQIELARALELAPDEPAVLNNLALSYALDGKAREAENLLRRAANQRADGEKRQRVRQNLALLVGLNGRVDEAQSISNGALPPEHVKANVAFLREQNVAGSQVSGAGSGEAIKAASAGGGVLPMPTYQLGGPKR